MQQRLRDVTVVDDGSARRRSYAVVLELDDVADRRVRGLWSALDRRGVPSAAFGTSPGCAPHVTLAIVDTAHPHELVASLRSPLAAAAQTPLPMTALGFFLSPRAPAYLAVAPTSELLGLHAAVHSALGTTGSWPYYRPGAWTPHCTLAMDVASPSLVAEAIGPDALPIKAVAGGARVAELPSAARRDVRAASPARPSLGLDA